MYNKNLLKCHLEMNCLPVPEDHVETTSLWIQKTGLVTIYMTWHVLKSLNITT